MLASSAQHACCLRRKRFPFRYSLLHRLPIEIGLYCLMASAAKCSRQACMWCKCCRQDVPGLISPGEKCYCCARCGSVLVAEPAPPLASEAEPAAGNPVEAGEMPARRYDPWELNEQLRHIQRMLQPAGGSRPRAPGAELRWDMPAGSAGPTSEPARWATLLSWPLLALGFGTFTCGAALVVLSLLMARSELWRIGLPTILLGQFGLLLALLVQIAGKRRGRKAADGQLLDLEHQLESIRRRLADGPASRRLV